MRLVLQTHLDKNAGLRELGLCANLRMRYEALQMWAFMRRISQARIHTLYGLYRKR